MKHAFPLTLLLTLCFTGCTTVDRPVGADYYVKTTSYFSWEHDRLSQSLYFRGPRGAARVWENFTGPLLVEGTTVLFAGRIRPGESAFFAVEDGGARLEVGKPILAFEAERESADVSTFVDEHQVHTGYLKRLSDGFELEYSGRHGVNDPDRYLSLTWAELSTLMHRVEAEGRRQKDRSGVSYLRIDYSQKK